MGQEKLIQFLGRMAPKSQKQRQSDEDAVAQRTEFTPDETKAAMKFLTRLQKKMNLREEELHPLDKESLETVLKSNQRRRDSCLSLPFTLVFFVLFAVSCELHERVRLINRVEDAVDEGISASTFGEAQSKWVKDCTTADDIWKFLKQTVVAPDASPWFQQQDQFGNLVPPEQRDGAFNKFHLVGGLLLEQARSLHEPCVGGNIPRSWDCLDPDAEMVSRPFGPALKMERNSSTNRSVVYYHGEGFVPLAMEGDPEMSFTGGLLDHARRLSVNLDGGVLAHSRQLRGGGGGDGLDSSEGLEAAMFWTPPYTRYPFFLFEQSSIKELQERVNYLQQHGWIDRQTKHLSMKGLLFNIEHDLMTRVSVMFYFASSGALDVALKITTMQLTAYPDPALYVIDALWVALLIVILVTEMQEFCATFKRGRAETVSYLSSFWNWLDWATIILGICIVSGFLYQYLATMEINDMILALPKVSDALTADDQRRHYKLHLSVDSISHFVMYYRMLLSLYMLVLMMRFFKAFRAQPRLALVTTTMYVAGSDVVHFLIVFCTIFSTYALSSVMLFGRRLTGFSTFQFAITNCFAIACGEFNWAELSSEHPLTTAFWFWSFMLVVFFVLLNMVIAIILDVYSEVRSQSEYCPPLWTQFHQLAKVVRHGSWVREIERHTLERSIMDLLAQTKSETISAKDLKEGVPEMNNKHLKELIDQVKIHDEVNTQRMRISDAMRAIGVIHVNVGRGMEAFKEAKKETHADLALVKQQIADLRGNSHLPKDENPSLQTKGQVAGSASNLDANVLSKLTSEVETLKDQYTLLAHGQTDCHASEFQHSFSEPEKTEVYPRTPCIQDREGGIATNEMKQELREVMNKMNEVLHVTQQLCGLVTLQNADSVKQSSEILKARDECNENTKCSKQVLEEMRKLNDTIARERLERTKLEARIERMLGSSKSPSRAKSQERQQPIKPSKGLKPSTTPKQSRAEVVHPVDHENLGYEGVDARFTSHQYNNVPEMYTASVQPLRSPTVSRMPSPQPDGSHQYDGSHHHCYEHRYNQQIGRLQRPRSCHYPHQHHQDLSHTQHHSMHHMHKVPRQLHTQCQVHPKAQASGGAGPSSRGMTWSPRFHGVHPYHNQAMVDAWNGSHGPPPPGYIPSHAYVPPENISVPTEYLEGREEVAREVAEHTI